MLTSTSTAPKSKARTGAKRFAIGDRVTFTGTVLRVLAGDEPPAADHAGANGISITVKAQSLADVTHRRCYSL